MMNPITDRDLVQRWQQGDESAFAEIVSRHEAMVLGVARRVLGDHHAAEDVRQAVFLVLARKAASLATGGPDLGGWLHRVTRDLARNRRAADQARRCYEGVSMSNSQQADPVVDAEMHRELVRQLDDALAVLPDRQRASVVLHHLEGLSVSLVAVRLGASEGSVCQWISRGRERLRCLLERRGVAVGVLLPLLLDDSAVLSPPTTTGGASSIHDSSAAARALADAYVWQQTVTKAGIGIACAVTGLGLVAVLTLSRSQEEQPMRVHPIIDAAAVAALAVSVPALSAADGPGSAGVDKTPAAVAPAVLSNLVRGQVATIGEAAQVLSDVELLIRVDPSLQDLPILWPKDDRFTGTPKEIMKQIVYAPGQPPMVFGGSHRQTVGQPPQKTVDIRPHRVNTSGNVVPPEVF